MNLIVIALVALVGALPPEVERVIEEQRIRLAGPGVLNVELAAPEPDKQLFTLEERKLMLPHRREVVMQALDLLQRNGDPVSALILGEFDERSAVPLLRNYFIASEDTYGWETSRPCALDPEQHPAHHAYEEALAKLTHQPLKQTIRLTVKEQEQLRARDDDAALYILYRLAPTAALEVAAARFRRNKDPFEQFASALAIERLAKGARGTDLAQRLGPPDVVFPRKLQWNVLNVHQEPEHLVLLLDGRGMVVRATVEPD